MSDSREQLARQIREALGEANDPDLPVVIIVGELVKRIAALENMLFGGLNTGNHTWTRTNAIDAIKEQGE